MEYPCSNHISHQINKFLTIFLMVVFLDSVQPSNTITIANVTTRIGPPTYCVDSEVLKIFSPRLKCIGDSIEDAVKNLKTKSTSEYLRVQELLAYDFFINTPNPFKRPCSESEFEFIPILPLHWVASQPNVPDSCSYKSLIGDILKFVNFVKGSRKVDMSAGPMRFTVASTFNMRTSMGTGMSTQNRRGLEYDTVTQFVTSLQVGHYERYPQCPDLLRKSWKYVVEIPYLPLGEIRAPVSEETLRSIHRGGVANTAAGMNAEVSRKEGRDDERQFLEGHRPIVFFFSGRLLLWGPERVCSVRTSLASIANRDDVLVVNTTEKEWSGPVQAKVFNHMRKATFCIITKADSYSSSTFYSALFAGCIPVVVSDWFVFSFPWAIPYSEFVIRIMENDFVKDPYGSLQEVKRVYTASRIQAMRSRMLLWLGLLSYEPVSVTSHRYALLRSYFNDSTSSTPISTSPLGITIAPPTSRTPQVVAAAAAAAGGGGGGQEVVGDLFSVLPFEMMLLEMRYALNPGKLHPVVPCVSPYTCTREGKPLPDLAMPLKGFLKETRSHLCQHVGRLIGHYKIVYFMQCVRILWPLQPGKLQKADIPRAGAPGARPPSPAGGLTEDDLNFMMNFHALTNVSKAGNWTWITYPRASGEVGVKTLRDLDDDYRVPAL